MAARGDATHSASRPANTAAADRETTTDRCFFIQLLLAARRFRRATE
jgi:hypothetical protein